MQQLKNQANQGIYQHFIKQRNILIQRHQSFAAMSFVKVIKSIEQSEAHITSVEDAKKLPGVGPTLLSVFEAYFNPAERKPSQSEPKLLKRQKKDIENQDTNRQPTLYNDDSLHNVLLVAAYVTIMENDSKPIVMSMA